MLDEVVSLALAGVGVVAIVWGAESFAEHLAVAATRRGVSTFALALLLAGAEPEQNWPRRWPRPSATLPRLPSVTSWAVQPCAGMVVPSSKRARGLPLG